MITEDFFIQSLAQMFQIALKVAMPLLLVTLIVGVFISILQVVTQVQEMTLTFVPKLIFFVVTLAIAGPWMLELVVNFARSSLIGIARL